MFSRLVVRLRKVKSLKDQIRLQSTDQEFDGLVNEFQFNLWSQLGVHFTNCSRKLFSLTVGYHWQLYHWPSMIVLIDHRRLLSLAAENYRWSSHCKKCHFKYGDSVVTVARLEGDHFEIRGVNFRSDRCQNTRISYPNLFSLRTAY